MDIAKDKNKEFKVWINTCEVSADLQTSLLLNKLKQEYPNIKAVGMGGDRLAESGQENFFHIKELSIMGITEIISALPRIIKLLNKIKVKILEEKPDAIVLVDSAEFNFPLAKFAKKHNIPVYYFIPPKVWAWRKGRIKYLKKYVNTILCIFPFEEEFYKNNNMHVEYIQNPLVDELKNYTHVEKQKNRIALLPGSRKTEVSRLLPTFAATAKELYKKYPQLEFYIIKAPNFTEEYLSSYWNSVSDTPPIQYIDAKNRYEFIASCNLCIAASGTATLETALLKVPTLITYKASFLSYIIANALVTTRAGLANLVLDDELFPEFLQYRVTVENLTSAFSKWYDSEDEVDKVHERLDYLAELMTNNKQNLNVFDKIL